MTKFSSLLYDSPPLVVNPEIAVIFGLREAIVLQQLHYWLENKKKRNDQKSIREGQYWVHNTLEEWHAQFPFMPIIALKRVFKAFKEKNIIIVQQFNKSDWDQKNFYTINYVVLNKYIENAATGSDQDDTIDEITLIPSTESQRSHGENHLDPIDGVTLIPSFNPETSPEETNPEITQPIQLVGTGGNPVVDLTPRAEVIAIQEEGNSFSNKDKYLPGDCSSVEQNSSISHEILDSIEPACSAYFGSYYPTARSFFESMTVTSADHATKLATLQKTVFEKYPVDIVKAAIATIRQWESHGDLEYYNPVYFLRALEEENEMQYVYTKFKQFCMEYFSSNEDALEVYNFYTTVLKSKEDMRSAHAKEGVPLHERRINNVKSLVEKQGLIEFINMIRHYSQEYKLGKLRCAPSIARFSNYFETYTKNKSNKSKQKTASAPISNIVPETTIRKIAATPYERIGSKYDSEKWEYCNWSYQCECGAVSEYWTEVCPSCNVSISQAASRDKFFSMFRICTCGELLHETDKTCPQCKMEFIIENAIARLEKKLKNNERKRKDEHGANARVCQDAEH